MTQPGRRVYRSRDPVRIILGIVLAVVLAAVILAVCIFFGFRKYTIYTSDGLRVEVPWLEETTESSSLEAQT